ncbi:chemotaxis protein CheW [Planctomicrobium sp. SH668]|uniref:chemotaxis protein CheW n=1 Tax=Planctomicrobium sp. SH668 TaxID=3448126 RepID=UPI003F5B9F1B
MSPMSNWRLTGSALHLSLRIAGKLHAIPIQSIVEVLPALPVESIAKQLPYVKGVVYLRGHLIPVIDGAGRLGLTSPEPVYEPHLICLNIGGRLLGLEVDEAIDLIEIPVENWLPASHVGANEKFLLAVTEYEGEIIRILAPDQLSFPEEAVGMMDFTVV